MESTHSTISCPRCGKTINVNDLLYHQVQDQLKKEFEKQLAEKEITFKAQQLAIASEKEALQSQIDNAVKSKLSREGIIQVGNALATQENKGEKMVMLYDYLTGNEFRAQVEVIIDGFNVMQTSLNAEKKVMMKSWAERQKQIDKVILNTTGMYGSIKGIAGSAVKEIKALEMEEDSAEN